MLAQKAELNYYPEEIYEYPRKVERKKKIRRKKRKNESKMALKTMLLFSGIIIMGISLFILFRYVNITKMRMELTQLETQRVELEKSRLELTAELDGIKSSPIIMEDAKNKLGMSFPKEEQIAYISVGDKKIEKAENEDNKMFKLISSLF